MKKEYSQQNITSTIVLLLVISLYSICYGAVTTSAEGLNVAVYPILEKNQMTEDNFFNILVKPGEKEKLKLKLENTSNEKIVLDVNIMTAGTNSNGGIDYTKSTPLLNESLEYKIEDLFAEKKSEVELDKNESKVVEFEYEIPKKGFDGSLLGAFYITEQRNETEKFDFKFSQVIGIQMQEAQNSLIPKFNLDAIDIMQFNRKASFMITIENLKAAVLKNMDFHGEIFKNESKVIKFDFDINGQSMAPNSNYILPIEIPTDIGINAGLYTLKLSINDKGRKKDFVKEFEVTEMDLKAAGYVPQADGTDKMSSSFYLVVLLVAILIGATVIYLMYISKKRKPTKTKRKKRK